jgi:DNA-binding MarR family transcriptional regulator
MTETWTSGKTAEELLNVFPIFGRIMAPYVQSGEEAEATFMQVRALFFLLEKPITASELARKRRVSLQSASVLVQGLVERGWVTRIPNPQDRRQFLLEVTPEGLARAQAARDQIASHLAGFLEGLTEDEIAAAQVFLPALQRVLTSHLTTDDTETE